MIKKYLEYFADTNYYELIHSVEERDKKISNLDFEDFNKKEISDIVNSSKLIAEEDGCCIFLHRKSDSDMDTLCIFKYTDERYCIMFYENDNNTEIGFEVYFCDQFDGLLKCIKDNLKLHT